jgi:hypothetical protein
MICIHNAMDSAPPGWALVIESRKQKQGVVTSAPSSMFSKLSSFGSAMGGYQTGYEGARDT